MNAYNIKDYYTIREKPYLGLQKFEKKYGIKLPNSLVEFRKKFIPEFPINLYGSEMYFGFPINEEFIFFFDFTPDKDIEFALENDYGFLGQIQDLYMFAYCDSNQGGIFIDIGDENYGKVYRIENYDEKEDYFDKNIIGEIITVATSFDEFFEKISLYKVVYDRENEKNIIDKINDEIAIKILTYPPKA